jgi:hypothetical protein
MRTTLVAPAVFGPSLCAAALTSPTCAHSNHDVQSSFSSLPLSIHDCHSKMAAKDSHCCSLAKLPVVAAQSVKYARGFCWFTSTVGDDAADATASWVVTQTVECECFLREFYDCFACTGKLQALTSSLVQSGQVSLIAAWCVFKCVTWLRRSCRRGVACRRR